MHYSQGHMEHIPGKNYMLGHKASLNTFEKTKIVSSNFYNHKAVRKEINKGKTLQKTQIHGG